jgi:hypothetical protein
VNETCPSLVVVLGGSGSSFGSPTSFGTGSAPKDVGVGEFNDDGDPDLVIPNHGSHNLSVLLGSTGGTFTAPTNFNSVSDPGNPTADGPAGVAVADFNADGYQDFASANDNTSTVAIFLGTRPYPHPLGANPMRISLVPAFKGCEASSANSTHGSPLNFRSCNPPVPASSTVKAGLGSVGWASVYDCAKLGGDAQCNESAPNFLSSYRPDVRVAGAGRDVQCRLTGTPVGCVAGADYNPNGAPGPYTTICVGVSACNAASVKASPFCAPVTGSEAACIAGTDITATATLAQASGSTVDPTTACSGVPPTQLAQCIADKSKFLGHAIRVTDHYNCNPSAPGGDANACPASATTSNRAATLVDLQFPVPVDCLPNPEGATTAGSTCGTNTTANALVPGSVIAGKQAVVEIGEIQQLDSGPDGVRGNSDDQIFSVQGVYLP